MNKKYRLIVFDWEGTLGDTLGQIVEIIIEAANHLNLGKFDEILARQVLIHGLNIGIKKIFPNLTPELHHQLLSTTQRTLSTRTSASYLLPGARTLIEEMSKEGYLLAIATNKGQQSMLRHLALSKMKDYFPVVRCAGQVPAKPCPQMLLEIMEEYGVSPSETLMIGDSLSDIEMASSIQVDSVGVNFYDQEKIKQELLNAGALAVFDHYQPLQQFIASQK